MGGPVRGHLYEDGCCRANTRHGHFPSVKFAAVAFMDDISYTLQKTLLAMLLAGG